MATPTALKASSEYLDRKYRSQKSIKLEDKREKNMGVDSKKSSFTEPEGLFERTFAAIYNQLEKVKNILAAYIFWMIKI